MVTDKGFLLDFFISITVPSVFLGAFKDVFFIIVFLKILVNILFVFFSSIGFFIFPIIISSYFTFDPIFIIPFLFSFLTSDNLVPGIFLVILSLN